MKKIILKLQLFLHLNDDDLKVALLIGIPWLLFSLWFVAKADLSYLY